MFDFDKVYKDMMSEKREREADELKRRNKRSEIAQELAERLDDFRNKLSLRFDIDRSPDVVSVEHINQKVLDIKVKDGERYDVSERVQDVNARKGVNIRDVFEDEAVRAIIEWCIKQR